MFDEGTTLELSADARAHSRFTGWDAACAGQEPCAITMDGPKTVAANFLVRPSVAAGTSHTCAVSEDGRLRCWGSRGIGHDQVQDIGNGVGPSIIEAGDVPVGTSVVAVGAGEIHACVITSAGALRCFGRNGSGQLGYDSTVNVGDGTGPTVVQAGDVDVGGRVLKVDGGGRHTCALLESGSVRCWGNNQQAQLGYNHQNDVGNGVGARIRDVGDVPLGAKAIDVCAGYGHSCAVTESGQVRCWGSGLEGQLGYGGLTRVGDGIGPSIIAIGGVPVGETARAVTCGTTHTCALLTSDAVRCWGSGRDGQLGYGSESNVGDGQGSPIATRGDVPVGGLVRSIRAGIAHTCAVLESERVRCWGAGLYGRLGYDAEVRVGSSAALGIIQAGDVPIGVDVAAIDVGSSHTCAMTTFGTIRCWGSNSSGQLGYGHEVNVGDGVGPTIVQAGDVEVW